MWDRAWRMLMMTLCLQWSTNTAPANPHPLQTPTAGTSWTCAPQSSPHPLHCPLHLDILLHSPLPLDILLQHMLSLDIQLHRRLLPDIQLYRPLFLYIHHHRPLDIPRLRPLDIPLHSPLFLDIHLHRPLHLDIPLHIPLLQFTPLHSPLLLDMATPSTRCLLLGHTRTCTRGGPGVTESNWATQSLTLPGDSTIEEGLNVGMDRMELLKVSFYSCRELPPPPPAYDSRNFTLSPETTDCDSADLESELSVPRWTSWTISQCSIK